VNLLAGLAGVAYIGIGIVLAQLIWYEELRGDFDDDDYAGLAMDAALWVMIAVLWPILLVALLFGVALTGVAKAVVILAKRGH